MKEGKDSKATDFRSNVIYTHTKFLHPSIALSSNKITLNGKYVRLFMYMHILQHLIKRNPYHTAENNNLSLHTWAGISNGQVIFNVSDELTEDMYEVVDAEDPVVEAGRVKYAIQMFASVSLWIPNKLLDRYWKRRHVIILPHWAFNKLILGNLV